MHANVLALVFALATVVAAAPGHCPPGETSTIYVTTTVTTTIRGSTPTPTGHSPPPRPTTTPSSSHSAPRATPSPSKSVPVSAPPSMTSYPGSGSNGNGGSSGNGGNGGSSGSGGNGGNSGSGGNGGGDMYLCCNQAGGPDSAIVTLLDNLLKLDLSNDTGLAGLGCTIIGEGHIGQCSGSLLNCSNLSFLGLGPKCSA